LLENRADPETIEGYIELLLSPSQIEEKIITALNVLNNLAVTPDTAIHPLVHQGYQMVDSFLTEKTRLLKQHRGVFFVYGSMRFDDPHNLDLDSVVITEIENVVLRVLCETYWTDELVSLWGTRLNRDTDGPGYTSVERLNQHCKQIKNRNSRYLSKNAVFIEGDFDFASSALTGFPYYLPNPQTVETIKKSVFGLSIKNPLMGSAIYMSLAQCIEDRLSRRGGFQ